MIITLDLSPKIVAGIDARLGTKPTPPTWPFEKRAVQRGRLNVSQLRLLDAYWEEKKNYDQLLAAYEEAPQSRSSVVEEILEKAFAAI